MSVLHQKPSSACQLYLDINLPRHIGHKSDTVVDRAKDWDFMHFGVHGMFKNCLLSDLLLF